jgi:hypothetical protein
MEDTNSAVIGTLKKVGVVQSRDNTRGDLQALKGTANDSKG